MILASYPGLLTEFLAFPMNIFRADCATGWYFVIEYLGWTRLWPLLLSGVAVVLASRIPWREPSPKGMFLMALPVVLFSMVVLTGPAPHPLIYSVQDSSKAWLTGGKRVVPSLSRPTRSFSLADKASDVASTQLRNAKRLRYDHVLIFVMEGVTTDRFEREFLSRPQGYYAKVRDRSAWFSGYHTTNLDSYTSLIAMLTSVQVPYRCYANPHSYDAVNDSPNLVAALRQQECHTLYVSTAQYHPFIPVRRDWDRIMLMSDFPQREGLVTVAGSKVEEGVEDRAAIPAIVEFVKTHPRTLVMQEMLVGHSPQWMARMRKSQLEYYDEILLELLRDLEENQLIDRTLLVLVSDHGDRANSANARNYNVPLLVAGQGISPMRTSSLLSHMDLQQVICHFLADQPLPQGSESLLTVGSTERWVYGKVTARGNHLFIDNDTGAILSSHGRLNALSLYEQFQGLLNAFVLRYQP